MVRHLGLKKVEIYAKEARKLRPCPHMREGCFAVYFKYANHRCLLIRGKQCFERFCGFVAPKSFRFRSSIPCKILFYQNIETMSSYLQELFSESPYAAAVATKHLRTHCSNCFEKAKSGCSKCSSVVYCDRNCQAADWPWHKAECQAFLRRRLEPETASINERERERESQDEEFVRILGRVLIRRRKDNGEVSLSEKFPVFAKVWF